MKIFSNIDANVTANMSINKLKEIEKHNEYILYLLEKAQSCNSSHQRNLYLCGIESSILYKIY